jgi:hypothetical protein
MEAGMNRSAIYRLFGRFGYGQNLVSSPEPDYSQPWLARHDLEFQDHLGRYRDEDRDQWVDFISKYYEGESAKVSKVLEILGNSYVSGRYQTEDINAALDFARSHPMGPLVLHRILQIFAIEDHPAK